MKDEFQNVGFNKKLNEFRSNLIKTTLKGDSCLEIGCGEGQITTMLSDRFDDLTILDKEQSFLDGIPNKKGLTKVCSMIETYIPQRKFDTIVCSNVIEHLDNPIGVLDKLRGFGHKDSVFIFTMPNGLSINRIIGADSGMIPTPLNLGEQDIKAGHQRMYGVMTFFALINSNFNVLDKGTYFYKPFPNDIMEKLPDEIIQKCFELGTNMYGAEMYIIAKNYEPDFDVTQLSAAVKELIY